MSTVIPADQYLAVEADGFTHTGLPDAIVRSYRAAHPLDGCPDSAAYRTRFVAELASAAGVTTSWPEVPEVSERVASAAFLTLLCYHRRARVVAFGPPLSVLN